MKDTHPTFANGKICYLEIPALDIEVSAAFYSKSFGWKLRKHNSGSIAFDDGVGEVSGMWVTNRKPMNEAGIIISIMVDDAQVTAELVKANGGKIVYSGKEPTGEVILHFTDPAGNLMGIYQEASRT